MTNADQTAPAITTRAQTLIALLVAVSFFMENLDGTVIATALPSMARSFGAAPVDLDVGMSAYLLTLGVFIPASGWLAERFGARRIFATAIALFTIASALCGMVQDVESFVAMRILQGMGGAMMVPVGRLVVLRATPKERLITAIATLTWPALVAPILGPPVGGFIVEHASWRWIFYLNLPIGVAAFAAVFLLIPAEPARRAKPFDVIGFLLSGGVIVIAATLMEAIGNQVLAWRTLGGLGLCGAVLTVTAIRHFRRAESPLLDFHTLRVPTFAVSILGGSLFRMAIGAVPFLLPLMFQTGFGYSAFHAGLLMIAVFAGNLAMKPATTWVLRRFGFRRVLIVNGLGNALSLGACALLTPSTPVTLILGLLFVGGMCRSMQFTALGTIAFADVAPVEMAAANTMFSTVMQLTMGLGVTCGALAARAGEFLAGRGPPAFQIAFIGIALVAIVGMIDSFRLPVNAGGSLAGEATGKH